MAFKGGFLIKPTETNVSAIANLYLQGKMAIEDKKERIDKQTSESLVNLGESVNFAATGVQDFDSMMLQYGASTRSQARSLKDQFDRKEINLSQFNAGMGRLTADAKIASQYPVIIKDQIASVKKQIDEGKLSDINLELTGFFKDRNASPQALRSNYQLQHVNGVPTYFRTYEYIEDGKRKVATESADISSIIDPNRTTYRKIDTDSDVKTFVDILGDKGAVGKYTEIQDLNGTKVYGRLQDDSKLESVKNFIEDRVESYSNKDLVSIAYDELGFRAKSFSDFDEKSLKKRAERRKGSFTDSTGKGIDFSYKDLILETNERGDFILSENQAELVRGYLRNKHSAAIQVQYDEKFVSPPAEPKVTKAEEIERIPLVTAGYTLETLKSMSEAQQTEYNAFVGSTSGVLQNTELQAILSGAGNKAQSIVLPGEVSENISKTIQATSFTGQKITSINSIVGVQKADGTFEIMLIGPSKVGATEIGAGAKGVIEKKATSEKIISESMSSMLSEAEAKRLYLELWDKNEDFRNRAMRASYTRSLENKNSKEAIYTIMQGYKPAELKPNS